MLAEVVRSLRRLRRTRQAFLGSASYWERRYAQGGTSGAGSYGEYAAIKAEVINEIMAEWDVQSVIEYGCGDGNQLALLQLPSYVGLDVAPTAVAMCAERFRSDATKSFFLYDPKHHFDRTGVFRCDAALSQEVIFHLVEDRVYEMYMRHLFDSAGRLVVICAADVDWQAGDHERHRVFTEWIEANAPDWRLAKKIASPQPYDAEADSGLLSDFFVYARSPD